MKISVSRVKLFKACRKAFQFKYIEGLEPVQKAEPLTVGLSYHSKIEDIYKFGLCDTSDLSKESAMALAYEKYIYPRFKMQVAEDWFEYQVNDDITLVGRVDGIAEDGYLVEHKTTGATSIEQYEYDLLWDDQILAYMLAKNCRKMWYTVIRKPTIRQRRDEDEEEFFNRMCRWYDEDTDQKIRLIEVTRSDEDVERFKQELTVVADEIRTCEIVPYTCYRNPLYCNQWGHRCEYSSICFNYDPNEVYVEFERRKDGDQKTR